MTGTIWASDDTVTLLPLRGQKVKILRFSNPKVYRSECCQFTTRFKGLSFEQFASTELIATQANKTGVGAIDAAPKMSSAPLAPRLLPVTILGRTRTSSFFRGPEPLPRTRLR
ncbi:hypothetical protein PI124_g2922 [Phytophthora idaei]|nr:hypothetical protein PI125_g4475 [Phytophthora idaei]KAG3152747.1 hypothetical protein PI126_g10393 [Phytophthora idaei]KAG3252476.1 hypothetical protein PI124_g2922 [Phytophthora idaei]